MAGGPTPLGRSLVPWIARWGFLYLQEPAPESSKDMQIRSRQIRDPLTLGMEGDSRALTTFSWHQTYTGIKIPGVLGVELPERLPSLAPPGRRHHSKVKSNRKFQT